MLPHLKNSLFNRFDNAMTRYQRTRGCNVAYNHLTSGIKAVLWHGAPKSLQAQVGPFPSLTVSFRVYETAVHPILFQRRETIKISKSRNIGNASFIPRVPLLTLGISFHHFFPTFWGCTNLFSRTWQRKFLPQGLLHLRETSPLLYLSSQNPPPTSGQHHNTRSVVPRHTSSS